jgi:hypothetical protein
MAKKKHELMSAYLIPKLDAGGQTFEEGNSNITGIGVVNFIKHEDKRIFLIDREYSEKEYQLLTRIASGITPYNGKLHKYEHISVFFKDGKTYFRSAAFGEKTGLKGVKYKQSKGLSLKDYTDEEVKRMMILSKPELLGIRKDNNLWYYQPESERLEEAVLKFRFTPVRFNYSYINHDKQFTPENKASKRIYINKPIEELPDIVKMEYGQFRKVE